MLEPQACPFAFFAAWLAEAEASEPNDPNAMALATVGPDGMPSQRMVLLKGVDGPEAAGASGQGRGFVFYTNTLSRKGQELAQSPRAALLFHWKTRRRQVRIEGGVTPVSAAEADAYFASRPRGSQLGAWASLQSQHLPSWSDLQGRLQQLQADYVGKDVPRPPHWSGYRVVPRRMEFWQDGEFRLHDRLVYTPDGRGGFAVTRLYP